MMLGPGGIFFDPLKRKVKNTQCVSVFLALNMNATFFSWEQLLCLHFFFTFIVSESFVPHKQSKFFF